MKSRWVWVGVGWAAAATSLPAQQTVRQFDQRCASCHAAIYQRYLATPMANASGAAADRLHKTDWTHPASGVRYTVAAEHGAATLTFSDAKDPRVHGAHTLDYFLGSGHLGVTYLYTQEGYLLESPIAWYASIEGYDMKPGLESTTRLPDALPMKAECLRCHMSAVAHAEPGTVNRYSGLPFAQTGITCESCHGDTTAHVRSRGKAPVVNPAKLDADRRDSICISCHLEGDVTVTRAGRSAVDYKPGERISDYLSFFVEDNADPLHRGVSEVEQLAVSQCKRSSGDRMSCSSCHDSHGVVPAEERVAFYRGKCLACHNEPAFARTHHTDNPDCTSCHMPRSTAANIPHVAWTDHRILKQPDALTISRPKDDARLTAIFSPQATDRDLAMAMYLAVLSGQSQNRAGALTKLRAAYLAGARDTGILEGLSLLASSSGNAAEAQKHLHELLTADPLDLVGLSNEGVYLARAGKLQGAVDLWQPAIARNQDDVAFARNLALAQCATGDAAGARKTMSDVLRFSPGNAAALEFTCDAPGH